MAKVRVYELAKEFGVESKTVMAKLQEMGEFVRSASSTVEPAVIQRLRTAFAKPALGAQFRTAVVARDYAEAEALLSQIEAAASGLREELEEEVGKLLRQRHLPGRGGTSRVDWLTGLWAAVTAPPRSEATDAPAIRPAPGGPRTTDRPGPRPRPGQRPGALGAALEDGVVELLRRIFALTGEDLVRIRKQSSGTQFGHDIEFDALDARSGTIRCHVECKNYTDMLALADIAPKLLQQFVYWENKPVDHFIVISPRAGLSNELSRLVQDCNHDQKLPFQILTWGPDEGVEELFRLAPAVYKEIYGVAAPKLAPTHVAHIADRWAAKLQPVVRLSESLRNYLDSPSKHQLYGETDFEAVRADSIALGALNEDGTSLSGSLHENVREWLDNGPEQVLLLLAEFGDGKSFFGYELSCRLSTAYLENPRTARIPLRIPLRALRDGRRPDELLEQRLKEIGVPLDKWHEATRDSASLVILDGFDEMTAQLDPETLARNVEVLAECVDFFGGPKAKVMISSRTHFFDHLADYERFLSTLGDPRILRIAPIPLKQRLAHLATYATQIGQTAKFEKLTNLYDPIGLAAKPLFLQMIKHTLPDLSDDHFDEVTLYETYIGLSLRRKLDGLQPSRRIKEAKLIDNLQLVLERVAVALHLSDTDYVELRDFAPGRDDLAELLWRMSGPAASGETADATSRVGVRSLLKPVAGIAPEKWPVDFFHRSMREFFIARALTSAIATDSEDGRRMLARVPLQPEIIDFVRLLMLGGPGRRASSVNYEAQLLSYARSAIRGFYDDRFLGGNALTLLYALTRKVPRLDWSKLALDHVDLTGADLTDLCFEGSSLRSASLDNARLVGIDLRNTDLSGVQLEPTTPVLAVAFDADSNIAYAAYGDCSIRLWTFGVGGRMTCAILMELDFQPSALSLSPFGDLIITGNESITVLSSMGSGEDWRTVARFPLNQARTLTVNDGQVVLSWQVSTQPDLLPNPSWPSARRPRPNAHGRHEIHIAGYDPVGRTLSKRLPAAADTSAVYLGGPVLLHLSDNVLTITNDHANPQSIELMGNGFTQIAARRLDDDTALIALGRQDGGVELHRLLSLRTAPKLEPLWSHRAHAGMVTDVCVSGMFVLSGGMDRTICLFTLRDGWAAGEPVRLHRTLECAGMRFEGAEGPKERAMLQALLDADGSRAGGTPVSRNVPTPAEVFGKRRRPPASS